ncbi:MAG: PAS domain-containing protein [Deltaproteobacteria bacterium]|nr:PAS domain-containing protein [Deltaproteobacteria bacterium]
MANQDKDQKTREPEKAARPKRRSKAGDGKHPDQKRAEREEELTLEENASEETEALEGEARDNPGLEAEKEKEPEAESSSTEDTEGERFPIVAMGASAGGLQPLEAFFEAVPADSGLAFVVITHTDPQHHSLLPDLIKKRAKIPVKVIEEDMPVEPNTVYMPPSDSDPVLDGETFHLKKRPDRPELHMPVDLFFKHLAQERGESAACVILSGTGTDGTQGLRLIKEKSGLAVAQNPDSARHAGMPRSAIETGLVDYVDHPSDMPERLIEYFKYPVSIRNISESNKKTEDIDPLGRILAFLATRTKHDFSLYKENTLIRRVERRMTITRCRNAAAYLDLLHREPEEIRILFQDLLIGVTSFFRDPEAFAFLRQQVLPDLVSKAEDGELRVWIPGCATGEEAYSIAILLRECLEERGDARKLQIFGTDIDVRAIERARQGTYVQNIASDVSPERLDRFFSKEDNRYRVKSDIRELVVFAEQNILSDPPFSKLDLLVCRNLLIYLKPEAQNKVIPLFHYSLREGGALFLGASEGLGRHHDLFEPLSKQHSIYRKKNHLIRPQVQFPTASRRLIGSIEQTKHEEQPEKPEVDVRREAEKILMQEHTPACVVVNPAGEILFFHGRTGKYLEPAPGEPSMQIGDMAREGLRFPLLSALRRVDKAEGEIRETDVRVKTNHEYQRIDLVVKRFSEPRLRDCRMVIFEETPEPAHPRQQKEDRRADEDASRREADLEQELMRVRQDYRSAMEELQTSNEELRSTNEELHSSNEELQSTNEELESSREELQSLNEELNTVNNELNSKMGELTDAYNAISSVLNSTHVAIVFLDNELKVKRFTPEATQLLNLMDSDLGRPVEHFAHNLEYDNMPGRVRQVLKTLSNVDEDVRTKEGHWYRMRIMVHREEEHIIDGVVLTFINIDAQKKVQKELEEMSAKALSSAKQYAELIVDTVRESLLVLDSQMRVVSSNRSFYDTFRTTADETEGKRLFELGNRQWDIPELNKLLQEVIEHNQCFQDYLVEHRFPEIGFKRMLLNARMLRERERDQDRILLAIEDVTGIPAPSPEVEK